MSAMKYPAGVLRGRPCSPGLVMATSRTSMDDDATWLLREGKLRREVADLCKEAIADGRHDRIRSVSEHLFELRQQLLDGEHLREEGGRAAKPYPWWAREWMRTTHWLLFAELLAREGRMVRIRNRLIGERRDLDQLGEQDERRPPRFIDRLASLLFQVRD